MSDSSLEIIEVDELELREELEPKTCSGLSDDSLSASLSNSLNNFYCTDDKECDNEDDDDVADCSTKKSSLITFYENSTEFCSEDAPERWVTKPLTTELLDVSLLTNSVTSSETEDLISKLRKPYEIPLETESKVSPKNAAESQESKWQTSVEYRKDYKKIRSGLFWKNRYLETKASGDSEKSKPCNSETDTKDTDETLLVDENRSSYSKEKDKGTAHDTVTPENALSSSKIWEYPAITKSEATSSYSLLENGSQTIASDKLLVALPTCKEDREMSLPTGSSNDIVKMKKSPKDLRCENIVKTLENFTYRYHKSKFDSLEESFTQQMVSDLPYYDEHEKNGSQSSSFTTDGEENLEVGTDAACYSKELRPITIRPRSSYALRTTKISHGFLYWLQNVSFVRKFTRGAKSTLNLVISTLDPGMSDFITSEPDMSISVITTNPRVASVVKNAFESIFSHIQNLDIRSLPVRIDSLPKEALGFESGLLSAEAKVDFARKRHLVPQKGTVLTVTPILVEITPLRWHSCACILLDDPSTKLSLHTYTQTFPVPNEYVEQAKLRTPDDFSPEQEGLSVSVGDVMSILLGISSYDWQKTMTDVSWFLALESATKTLAGMYKRYLEGWSRSTSPYQ